MPAKFRLAAVLRVRKLQEDMAMQGLAFANRMVSSAQQDRDRRVARYRSLTTPQGGMRAFSEFLREQEELLVAADSVGFGEKKLVEARVHADEWRTKFLEARKRVRILEKLETRRRLEAEAEESRRESKVIDDLVTTRWVGQLAEAHR